MRVSAISVRFFDNKLITVIASAMLLVIQWFMGNGTINSGLQLTSLELGSEQIPYYRFKPLAVVNNHS